MRLPSRFSRNHEAVGKLTSVIVDLAVEENWTSYVYCGDEGGKRQKFRMIWGDSYIEDGRTTAAIPRHAIQTSGPR